jgi:hypothetical protein
LSSRISLKYSERRAANPARSRVDMSSIETQYGRKFKVALYEETISAFQFYRKLIARGLLRPAS